MCGFRALRQKESFDDEVNTATLVLWRLESSVESKPEKRRGKENGKITSPSLVSLIDMPLEKP